MGRLINLDSMAKKKRSKVNLAMLTEKLHHNTSKRAKRLVAEEMGVKSKK